MCATGPWLSISANSVSVLGRQDLPWEITRDRVNCPCSSSHQVQQLSVCHRPTLACRRSGWAVLSMVDGHHRSSYRRGQADCSVDCLQTIDHECPVSHEKWSTLIRLLCYLFTNVLPEMCRVKGRLIFPLSCCLHSTFVISFWSAHLTLTIEVPEAK